jgi:hypothetical protein
MDIEENVSPLAKKKILLLNRKILFCNVFYSLLLVLKFLPFFIGIVYFLFIHWQLIALISFFISLLLNIFLSKSKQKLHRKLDVYKITIIAYRVENGELFPPDNADYLLFRKMGETLFGKEILDEKK